MKAKKKHLSCQFGPLSDGCLYWCFFTLWHGLVVTRSFVEFRADFMPPQDVQECILVGCKPSTAVDVSPATHAPLATYTSAMHTPYHTRPLSCMPVHRILDTRLWKYYLSATSFADGKNAPYQVLWTLRCPIRTSKIKESFKSQRWPDLISPEVLFL